MYNLVQKSLVTTTSLKKIERDLPLNHTISKN